MTNELILDGNSLTIDKIERFLFNNQKVRLSHSAKKKINESRRLVEKWIDEEKVIYGVTTGFGEFANVNISFDQIKQLQKNLIISHAVGVGEMLPLFIVKIMMLLRVNALAKGHSGIRVSTIELLIEMINNNIIPLIPSQGSVGSSGDLAPLSHLVLAMIGKGKVFTVKNIFEKDIKEKDASPSDKILIKFNLSPAVLEAKEGLALINGTQMMTAFAVYNCINAKRISKLADISGALSHEALRATDKAYDLRLHELRPYTGQINSAKNMLLLLDKSEIRNSHIENDPRVQDSYSLRCIPQVHGASRDAIDYVYSKVEIEINSANDNPLIFPKEGDHLEGGNFHGQPMALAMDFLGIALSEIANISERRIERLVNGSLSMLPRFLARKGGINSGFMIVQYTAASLVSENKVLAHPASVDSIPTSANQEDHNSMGSIAARKCFQIMKNVQRVLAIEILTACQGIEFLKPLKCGIGTSLVYNKVRKYIKPLDNDRELHKDLELIIKLIEENVLVESLENKIKLF
jgi:histidine ammonia-lyase